VTAVGRRILAAGGLLLLSGGLGAQEPVAELAWLAGCWVAGSGASRTEELWTAPAGGLLLGVSRTLRPGRSPAFEYLRIESDDDGPVYRASPGGRSPTSFRIVAAGSEGFRAELPEHDFPRAIEYRRIGADSLIAHVYGEIGENVEPAFSLHFARGLCPGVGSGRP